MTQPLVFISYSQQDEAEKEQLLAHLNVLRQSGGIDVWSDDQIRAGSDREAAISAAMAEVKVAILLLSANFFSADDLIEQMTPQLRVRQAENGLTTILPVLAKACAWNAVDWLTKLDIFPPDHQPIWRDTAGRADEQLARLAIHLAEIIGLPLEQVVPPELLGTAPSAPTSTANLGGVMLSNIRDTNITTGDIATTINSDGGDVVSGDKVSQSAQGQTIAQVAAGGTATINIYQQALQEREHPPADEAPAPGESPYKGLQYFDVADAALFFGRNDLTARLVGHVKAHPFLAVVGASGSGKSSLARAGLVAALQRGGPLAGDVRPPQDSPTWAYHLITPTAHPLKELAASLTRHSESVRATSVLIDDLAADARSLDLAVHRLSSDSAANHLLLLVDQFEELFTLCKDETERQAFVDNLLTAVAEPDGPTTMVITLRADFYAHCGTYEQLRLLLEKQQVYIGPMNPDELRAAIEQPAAQGDWPLEPGLVELLLADVGREPGALPLLSHALRETWLRRRGRTLTLAGYAAAGRVQGAIARTADRVYRKLSPEQQPIARSIFLRLTELGEGTQDTRRRVALTELILNPDGQSQVESVLKTLADARLIATSSTTAAADEKTTPAWPDKTKTAHAEVAHEALIREWPLLRTWLDEDREALRTHRRLTEAAQEWSDHEQHPDYLYRGTRLEQAEEWAKTAADLNALEQAFLQASAAERDRLAREQEEQQQRALEAARQLAAEAEARQKAEEERAEDAETHAKEQQKRAMIAIAIGVVAVIVAILAGLFGIQSTNNANLAATNAAEAEQNLKLAQTREAQAGQNLELAQTREAEALEAQTEAERQADLALARQLAAQSVGLLERGGSIETGLLLPLQAEQIRQQSHHAPILEVNDTLRQTLERSPLVILRHEDDVTEVIFNNDGTRLATLSHDGTVRLVDTATGEELAVLRHDDTVTEVTFNDDGTRLTTRSDDGTARLFDAKSGQELAVLLHEGPVHQVIFNDDGTRLATSSDDGTVRLFDAKIGNELAVLRHDDTVTDVTFNPDGSRLVTVSTNGTVRLWRVEMDDLVGLACHILSRNLSQVEWNDYIGPERDYECTCPNLPPGEGVAGSCEGD